MPNNVQTEHKMDQHKASHEEIVKRAYAHYEEYLYNGFLVGRLFDGGIRTMERAFNSSQKFSKVIELGAGGTYVLRRVRHQYDEYYLTDNRLLTLDKSILEANSEKRPQVHTLIVDASAIPEQLGRFDRIIASNLLEHMSDPEKILQHWYSRLNPGGVLSLLLPTDSGMLWRISRECAARMHPKISRDEYRYMMAKEHVNSVDKLIYIIDYRYPQRKFRYFPFSFLSLLDINFFLAVQIVKPMTL